MRSTHTLRLMAFRDRLRAAFPTLFDRGAKRRPAASIELEDDPPPTGIPWTTGGIAPVERAEEFVVGEGGTIKQVAQTRVTVAGRPPWHYAALLLVVVVLIGGVAFALTRSPDVAVEDAVESPAVSVAPPTFPPTEPPPATVDPAVGTLDDKDCEDFATQEEAQDFFAEAGGPDQDLHHLDPDGDGIPCDPDDTGGATPTAG